MTKEPDEGSLSRLVGWFDSRLGLSHPLLRPVPAFAVNPLYWLGALTVVAFLIQGITGVIMMLYYVPSPTQAYTSTQYVFQSVYYGRFLETIHLYTAYAMIMLAFMHMMRGYFVSVHKKPRELMWVTGMAMGFVTLGFGFTGYLLPWTVISKSATDVGTGMIAVLPPPIASFINFLVVGSGGDATTLLRFYDLHVVVLPAALLVLLTVKMYMLETHGIAEPEPGRPLTEKERRTVPIFPDVTLYVLELAALFGAGMLLISAAFPLSLPPAYSAQAASQIVAQPDWYFLWMYQLLKIQAFEGTFTLGGTQVPYLAVALTLVTLLFLALALLPLLDRGTAKRVRSRPVYVTLGVLLLAELVVLSVWGYYTPGQQVSNLSAALVLGGTAALVCGGSLGTFRILGRRAQARSPAAEAPAEDPRSAVLAKAAIVIALSAAGAFAIGSTLQALIQTAALGATLDNVAFLGASLACLATVCYGTVAFVYKTELQQDNVRRRVRLLEGRGA
jgi:quinol-cytochrome oxidoreductase complex cytochrome b subunit